MTPAAGYTAFLTYLLLAPDPWRIFGHLASEEVDLPPMLSDYVIHGITYCGLSAIWIWAARPTSLRGAAGWVVAAIGHGIALEFLQGFVPSRYPDLLDGFADAIGALIGGCIIVALQFRNLVTRS
jgi:VanZ family protein